MLRDFARLVVFDIETSATTNPAIVAKVEAEAMAERPSQGGTSKTEKALWDTSDAVARRVAEAVSRTALDVTVAEPLCVCWARLDQGAEATSSPERVQAMAGWDGETTLRGYRAPWGLSAPSLCLFDDGWLRELSTEMNLVIGPDTVIAGHNIEGYDLPVLLNAWRRAGVQPPEYFPQFTGRGWRGRTFDTMRRFPSRAGFIGMEAACEALGVAHEFELLWKGAPVDGSRVGAMYDAGAYLEIERYCVDDVRAEWALYMAMTGGDRWGTFDRNDRVAKQVARLRCELGAGTDLAAIAIYHLLEGEGLIPRVQVETH